MGEPLKLMIEVALLKAKEVIEKNIYDGLIYASAFYRQVWTRDIAISAISLRFLDDEKIRKAFENTIKFLEKYQSKRGQIPTYVDVEGGRIFWYSMDSTLWWIIACIIYDVCRPEAVVKAFDWISRQVLDESLLITSIRGCDWMDASLGREGKVLYINILWYIALKLLKAAGLDGIDIDPETVRKHINIFFWPSEETLRKAVEWGAVGSSDFIKDFISPRRKHYIHFVSYEYLDDRFDTLSNILAILSDVADDDKKMKILRYIEKEELAKPYPIKSLYPVVSLPGLTWVPMVDLFRKTFQICLPYHYHNGGIWPFIGGIYVATLTLFDRNRATEELALLAEANRRGREEEWEFNEWLHGVTGQPMGSKHQLWNAATYVLAYQAVVEGVDIRKIFSLN